MRFQFLALSAAVGPASALMDYEKLVAMVNNVDCVLPANYTISNFTTFVPTGGSSNQTVIKFGYSDELSNITTTCEKNATSKEVPSRGAPRFNCTNPLIKFIWQNVTLSMIERVCPEPDGTSEFEAAGQEDLELDCEGCDEGTDCSVPDFTAKFVSLQPSP